MEFHATEPEASCKAVMRFAPSVLTLGQHMATGRVIRRPCHDIDRASPVKVSQTTLQRSGLHSFEYSLSDVCKMTSLFLIFLREKFVCGIIGTLSLSFARLISVIYSHFFARRTFVFHFLSHITIFLEKLL